MNALGQGPDVLRGYAAPDKDYAALIVGRAMSGDGRRPRARLTAEDQAALAAAAAYVDANPDGDLSLARLARVAGMGGTKLKCRFKEAFGSTVADYVRNRRLARAEGLLAGTDLSVRQMALAVGYRDAGRFAELCRLRAGRSPSEYRRLAGH